MDDKESSAEINMNKIFKFKNLSNAQNFAYRSIKSQLIILGDDNMFWVVTMVDGNKLINQGYSAVK